MLIGSVKFINFALMNRSLKYIKLFHALLVAMLVVAMSACSTTRTVKRGQHQKQPKVSAKEYEVSPDLSKMQKKLIEESLDWQGTPYKYACSEKHEGTDCSGFVQQVFLKAANLKLPRNSAKQYEYCKDVKMKLVRPCDLVFFATGSDDSKISHVGIVLDQESFIHASSSKGVIVTRFDNPWWMTRIVRFGRVPGIDYEPDR